jgi:hypothetical protein
MCSKCTDEVLEGRVPYASCHLLACHSEEVAAPSMQASTEAESPGPLIHMRGRVGVRYLQCTGQADSFALKVRSLLLPCVQDPSNQCLLQCTAC